VQLLEESNADPKFKLGVIEAIYARRAVRRYTEDKVSARAVEELISAATQAPSAMNKQPWAFVVIQDPPLLKRISFAAKELLIKSSELRKQSEHGKTDFANADFDIFYGATTLITICAEKSGFQPVGDCYLAAENLMLAATAMGLSTCPIGFARDVLVSELFKTEIGIPLTYDAVLPIIVGYPSGSTDQTARNPAHILSWLKPLKA
jgi:nitroreductase